MKDYNLNTVTKFKIIKSDNLEYLEQEINRHLQEGWKLESSLIYVDKLNIFIQSLSRNEVIKESYNHRFF